MEMPKYWNDDDQGMRSFSKISVSVKRTYGEIPVSYYVYF